MPAVTQAQQRAAAIAMHEPEKLHKSNRGMLSMNSAELRKMAATSRRGLPRRRYRPTTDDAMESLMRKEG